MSWNHYATEKKIDPVTSVAPCLWQAHSLPTRTRRSNGHAIPSPTATCLWSPQEATMAPFVPSLFVHNSFGHYTVSTREISYQHAIRFLSRVLWKYCRNWGLSTKSLNLGEIWGNGQLQKERWPPCFFKKGSFKVGFWEKKREETETWQKRLIKTCWRLVAREAEKGRRDRKSVV